MISRGRYSFVTGVDCGWCGRVVPDGGAHIVTSPYGADHHVMYCPTCCPCQRSPR